MLRRTAAALDAALAGRALVRADLRWPTAASADLTGAVVLGTRPYGKHLLTRLDDGRTLHTHLRMDGRWYVVPTDDVRSAARSPRVRAVLASADVTAVGDGLGMLDLVRTRDEHTLVGHLGPDLLDDGFDPDDPTRTGLPPGRSGPVGIDAPGARSTGPGQGLDEALVRLGADRDRPVGEVLLDQHVVAGIGTIYMAESLFVERIWPWTPVAGLRDPRRLLLRARALMQAAVRAGRPPGRVHGRARRPCPRCGTSVRRGLVREPPMERPVFWCPRCQPAP